MTRLKPGSSSGWRLNLEGSVLRWKVGDLRWKVGERLCSAMGDCRTVVCCDGRLASVTLKFLVNNEFSDGLE